MRSYLVKAFKAKIAVANFCYDMIKLLQETLIAKCYMNIKHFNEL